MGSLQLFSSPHAHFLCSSPVQYSRSYETICVIFITVLSE